MRLRPLLSVAVVLWPCAPALAQERKEFAFQQDGGQAGGGAAGGRDN